MAEETIKLKDGRRVYKKDYVTAKTKTLVEFGYSSLTEDEVLKQVDKIVAGSDDLDVIGHFCKSDIETS